ncbi:MAG: NAD(P)-dependent oxidoreductase [Candidatus Thorarchaeota archaeon]|nr:NAD(P)-dependent oxidoreductase [Candidatus Thorarchaeota archaeon]
MTTIVSGGSGNLAKVLKESHPEYLYLSRKEMDVTDRETVMSVFDREHPTMCIHLAANTDVAGCETNHDLAYSTNSIGCRNIADACIKYDTYVIYTSTDYVFDGEKGLYKEEDPPSPINYYGLTKLLGEFEIRHVPRHLIIRGTMKQDTGWRHPRVPDDIFQSLLHYSQYSWILFQLIKLNQTGIIHVGYDRYNLYEYAKSRRQDVEAIKRSDIKSVRLPGDCSLDITKLKSILNLELMPKPQ